MGLFASTEEVYEHLGGLFEDVLADPALADRLRDADTVVQYRMTDPDALITVVLRADDLAVELGETEREPEIVLTADADTIHRFWLGALPFSVALATGRLRPEGPLDKVLALVPRTRMYFPRYRELVERSGRADLLDPQAA